MEFITRFPKSKGKNVIRVVVERLTKYVDFYSLAPPLKSMK